MSFDKTEHNQLVYSILEYLNDIKTQPGIDGESLEVASQCIATVFDLELHKTEQHHKYSIKPHALLEVFSAGLAAKRHMPENLNSRFNKFIETLRQKNYFDGTVEGTPAYVERFEKARLGFLENQKPKPIINVELAEKYKIEGNQKLVEKKYKEAIDNYTKAIENNPDNSIYYCNRAAAYSNLGNHQKAIEDAHISIKKDPKYIKAYSRLGLAHFSIGQYKEAVEAYSYGLKIDPTNKSLKDSLEAAEAELKNKGGESTESPSLTPPTANRSEPTQSEQQTPPAAGGLGGLAGLLNNPNIMNMARNFAAQQPPGETPNIQNMLRDPNLMNMAQQVMSQPGFSELLNDPNISNLAQNLLQNPGGLNNLFQGMFNPKEGPPQNPPNPQ